MKTATQLIILNTTKIKDSAIVIHTLSRDFGRRSFLVNVGKGRSMAMFLPLNIIEAEVIENPKSDLWKATGFSAIHPLNGIRRDLYKNTMTMFISEVLYRTVREGVYEYGLYEWCEKCILTLDALESDFSNFHIRFLMELAVAMGFAPSIDDIRPFAGERLREVSALMSASFTESMLIPLSGAVRNELAEIFLRYLSHHTESNINIQSLRVLRELYQ